MPADFSRRDLIKTLAAAGSAATVPAVAGAAPDRYLFDPAQPSDEEQFEACIVQLKGLLARMHPDCDPPTLADTRTRRGSRRICISALRPSVAFTGDGLYDVELDGGFVHLCDVRQEWSDMDRRSYLHVALLHDGHPTGLREIVKESQLVRKVEG
ncbi:twin-arginine translocation signal domain-containing protein [Rhizobium sp. TRM95111]|uniref:twin-arginine translocation signal domain-containing protein n=1 Tax=Rhizobium alarense TaxID=2846851 RepID=UPI001F3FB308|nr:twin-arginine translocation signal domain-containing protein [Rhizobium alarense]MCF3643000.1 twin-arginine translocation signal domain-containing protein [Rhizobium alarense]